MAPNVAIIIYTLYGHVAQRSCLASLSLVFFSLIFFSLPPVAEAEKRGIEQAGGSASIYQ